MDCIVEKTVIMLKFKKQSFDIWSKLFFKSHYNLLILK